ncbi:MAG: hypothetical protein KAX49_13595 [Halanaerobiales bacterium]|nr:hypothetical protein [Halanaerobiales bacterium]
MIKLNNITKIYIGNSTPFTALKAIDLTIKKGDFTTIMGASGSGKST